MVAMLPAESSATAHVMVMGLSEMPVRVKDGQNSVAEVSLTDPETIETVGEVTDSVNRKATVMTDGRLGPKQRGVSGPHVSLMDISSAVPSWMLSFTGVISITSYKDALKITEPELEEGKV